MRKLYAAAAAGLAVLAPVSAAADEKLTAAEIQKLLDGPTALGNWRGADTRQCFKSSGATVNLPKGGVPDEDK